MNKKKSLISTICILLVIVLVVGFLGFVTQGFKNWDTKTWFEKDNIEESPENKTPIDNEGDIVMEKENIAVDKDGNVLESGKVYSLPTSLIFNNTSTATTTESGITLQATILPTNASNKAVDWSVEWVENTGFAVDKNVTDYVSVTPNSDGSNVAVVNCLQPFGTQIKVIVISRENIDIKAECIIDYAQKIESVHCSFGDIPIDLGGKTAFFWNVGTGVGAEGSGGLVEVDLVKSSIYTIEDTFDINVFLGNETGASNSDLQTFEYENHLFNTYELNNHKWVTDFTSNPELNVLGQTIEFNRQYLRDLNFVDFGSIMESDFVLNDKIPDSIDDPFDFTSVDIVEFFVPHGEQGNCRAFLGFVSVQVNGSYSSFAKASLLECSGFVVVNEDNSSGGSTEPDNPDTSSACSKCGGTNIRSLGTNPPGTMNGYECRSCGYSWWINI